jgi:Cys-tRNA(Pro)/Cys-tRNA(Cys) deacylase
VALTAAGIPFDTVSYTHDPRAAGYATEAAEALGLDPSRVFKTLVVSLDGKLVVGVVPASGTLDLKALADALGGKRAQLADQRDAERKTGYIAGGISPVGQKTRLPTAVDESALVLPTMFVSGGRRGFEIEIAPADLVSACGAVVGRIGR